MCWGMIYPLINRMKEIKLKGIVQTIEQIQILLYKNETNFE